MFIFTQHTLSQFLLYELAMMLNNVLRNLWGHRAHRTTKIYPHCQIKEKLKMSVAVQGNGKCIIVLVVAIWQYMKIYVVRVQYLI